MNESKLLQTWADELKEQRREFYLHKKELYEELRSLGRWIYNETYDKQNELFRELSNKNLNYGREEYVKTYEDTYNYMLDLGVTYDKEHFIRTSFNGTQYTYDLDGVVLHSYYEYKNQRGHTERVYSIVDYYFYTFESKTLLRTIEGKTIAELNKLADKEVDAYIENLVKRVEKRFGEIITVRDDYTSNVAWVIFECEKGDCYLERIEAGGYNIQVLHNRILIKPIKK